VSDAVIYAVYRDGPNLIAVIVFAWIDGVAHLLPATGARLVAADQVEGFLGLDYPSDRHVNPHAYAKELAERFAVPSGGTCNMRRAAHK
jgi:hypothetical protein